MYSSSSSVEGAGLEAIAAGTTEIGAASVDSDFGSDFPNCSRYATYSEATLGQAHSPAAKVLARFPIACARAGSFNRVFMYSASHSTSLSSTGIFTATSSGTSQKEPISEISVGFPSASARRKLPEVSPAVGRRKLMLKSQAAMQVVKVSSGT